MGDANDLVIKNKKGLFAGWLRGNWFMPQERIAHIDQRAKEAPEGPLKEKAQELVAVLRSMPVSEFYWDFEQFDRDTNLAPNVPFEKEGFGSNQVVGITRKKLPMVVWHRITGFKNNPSHGVAPSEADLRREWDGAFKIAKDLKKFNAALGALGVPGMDEGEFKGAKQLPKLMDELVFERRNAETKALENRAFAVWSGQAQGFLKKDSSCGGLAEAVLYPSEAAAKRSAGSHAIKNGFVVALDLAIRSANPITEGSAAGGLKAAMAKLEERELQDMFERQGIERLRSKLAEYEAAQQEGAGPEDGAVLETPAARKPRL